MNIISLTEHLSVLDMGSTAIGMLSDGESAVLIDSGLDQRHFQKIDKLLNRPVRAIYHTHSHADHMGASPYFGQKYGAAMYIPAGEMSFTAMPELEGGLLYGGLPPAEMRGKFFMAPAIPAEKVPSAPFTLYGAEVVPLALPGHSPAHTGYLAEKVAFLGDSVFIPEVIDKHGVLYLYDPARAYKSLESIQKLDFERAVLCHKGIFDKAVCTSYVANQMAHIEKTAVQVEEHALFLTAENIARRLIASLNLAVNTGGWLLALSTIKGYLAMLEAQGRIKQAFTPDKGVLWGKE